MTTELAVVTAVGIATTQDAGRPGHTAVGVPVAGAWHRGRYERSVRLVSDSSTGSEPAIEVLAGRLALRSIADVVIAVTGPARVAIAGRRGASGVTLLLAAGEELDVTPDGAGPVYVAISGWEPPRTLGSCSIDTFSRLGGAPLSVGDVLSGDPGVISRDRVGWFDRGEPESVGPLRIVVPDADREIAGGFVGRRWTVHRAARSGVRLRTAGWSGPRRSLESFPVLPGAVQLTPDNEAIVLGPDGGLTGGYPVVGVVASADLDRVSTLAVGTEISFAVVDVTAAARAWEDLIASRTRAIADPSLLH